MPTLGLVDKLAIAVLITMLTMPDGTISTDKEDWEHDPVFEWHLIGLSYMLVKVVETGLLTADPKDLS